jgi:hypothetical protein
MPRTDCLLTLDVLSANLEDDVFSVDPTGDNHTARDACKQERDALPRGDDDWHQMGGPAAGPRPTPLSLAWRKS